jgi:hypothetical protein
MLSKAIAKQFTLGTRTVLGSLQARGVYQAGKEPAVFINRETKVICQGMTGKQVLSLL